MTMTNSSATAATYEGHITQTNERLTNIHVALSNPLTFVGACRELLEWCSDRRAFHRCFETNLMQCLAVVARVCILDGFDSELGYNLLNVCYDSRHLMPPENSDQVSNWYNDICCGWSRLSPSLNDNLVMHKNNMNPQQQMMWNGGQSGGGAVSVVTTVYPGTVQNGYSNQTNEFDSNAAYATPPAYGATKTGYSMSGYGHNGIPSAKQHPYPPASSYNPQMRSNYGQNPAQHMAAAAAVAGATAVATATATAVAFDPSQMQGRAAQYSQNQMHPQMAYQQSQPYVGYQRTAMPGYPTDGGRPMAPYPQTEGVRPMAPYAHQEGVRYMSQQQAQQARIMQMQQNGYPQHMQPMIRQHMPHGQQMMVNGRGGAVYPVRGAMPANAVHMQQSMQQSMQQRPAMDRAYSVPNNHMIQNRMCQPMTKNPMDNCYDSRQMDIKPQMAMKRVDLVSFPLKDCVLLDNFRLDHNIMHPNMTYYDFEINSKIFELLRTNPSVDVQLKCFHNDDPSQPNNWPVNQEQQISVQVTVNDVRQQVEHVNMPLYIKRFMQLGANRLQISVMQCCCSHLFCLRLVDRHPVQQLVRNFEQTKALSLPESREKIKRLLQMHSCDSNDVENISMKVSLKDPISQQLMVTPARGRECSHLQCFDLTSFLLMNKEKNFWACPICCNRIHDNLEVDLYMKGIISGSSSSQSNEVIFDTAANFTFPDSKVTSASVKMERSQSDTCTNGPPAKRIKTECPPSPAIWAGNAGPLPPPYSNGAPSPYTALSPYTMPQHSTSPSQPPASSRGPATPRCYQPPTPVTPGAAHGNPVTPGTTHGNPNSVEPVMQQQTSQEGSVGSFTGSAPYTPASVSSAGSLPLSQSGPHNTADSLRQAQTMPTQGELEQISTWDIDDLFQPDSRDNNQFLSDQELMKYLDQDTSLASMTPTNDQSSTGGRQSTHVDSSSLNPVMSNNTTTNNVLDNCPLSDEDFYSLINGDNT